MRTKCWTPRGVRMGGSHVPGVDQGPGRRGDRGERLGVVRGVAGDRPARGAGVVDCREVGAVVDPGRAVRRQDEPRAAAHHPSRCASAWRNRHSAGPAQRRSIDGGTALDGPWSTVHSHTQYAARNSPRIRRWSVLGGASCGHLFPALFSQCNKLHGVLGGI